MQSLKSRTNITCSNKRKSLTVTEELTDPDCKKALLFKIDKFEGYFHNHKIGRIFVYLTKKSHKPLS